MQLAETSIRRPVFATVLSLLLILIGVVSFSRLTVREYPRIDEPVVTVRTKLVGQVFRHRRDRDIAHTAENRAGPSSG